MDQSQAVELVEAMLDRDRFIAWLMERFNEPVGRASDPYDCPVARFLKDQGVKEVAVLGVRFWVGEAEGLLPGWVVDFVGVVDQRALWQKVELMGEFCLEVLACLGE